MKKEKLIKKTIKSLDYKKIHKVMTFLNWRWCGKGVPTIEELKQCARERCEKAIEINGTSSTGGFTAIYDNRYNSLTLYFYVSEIMNINGESC